MTARMVATATFATSGVAGCQRLAAGVKTGRCEGGDRELFAVSGNRDQRVGAIAGEQRSRANRTQLLAAAITDPQIRTMFGRGWLKPRFRGVYVVGYAPDGQLTPETEALLACGFDALLGGPSCGAAWGFIPWRLAREEIHITIQGEHRSRHAGIRIHRTQSLDARLDVRIHSGLPTVSPARAIVGMAGALTPRELERGLDDARSPGPRHGRRSWLVCPAPQKRSARTLVGTDRDRSRTQTAPTVRSD
jgi:hypothetical protein